MDARLFGGIGRILPSGLLLALALPPASYAQSEAVIRGQVTAAADGSAVAGASVRLRGAESETPRETTSDPQGRFVFQLVVPGAYVLAAEADGFAARELEISLEPREVRTLAVALELARLETTVEVSAGASVAGGTHSPSSTLLTAARVADLSASQQQSLPDAIAVAAPGMIRGHDDFVHIRGHEVALNPLINGVAFWENPHSLFSSGLSPAVIDSVNVMTGGFPAEYGNRFGGVLDVVTKSGFNMHNDGSAALVFGEAGRRSAEGEFGGHRGRFGYYGFGSILDSDRFVSPPDPEAIHDSGQAAHAFFQLDTNLGGAGLLKSVLMMDGSNFEIPNHPRDLVLRPLANASQRTRQQSAIVGWTRAWSRALAGASFYQRWSSVNLTPAADPLAARAGVARSLATLGGKLDVTRFSGRHTVKAGLDGVWLRPEEELSYDYAGYRAFTHLLGWPHIHFADSDLTTFRGREAGGQVSAYVQDAIELGDRITADVGVRVDRYALLVSHTHASPRVNVAWQVGRGATVHGSYNHFFVPPPIEGILSSSAGLTARIREVGVALPALAPTTENQWEVGASGPAGPLRVAATAYFRATDNPVHTTVWPDSRIYSYASFDRARAYGLEAKAEMPSLLRYGVTGYVNYALGRVDFYNPATGGFITEGAHLNDRSAFRAPMDQTHTLTAGASYRHATTGVWAGTTVEFGSGTPMGHGAADHEHGPGEADHGHAASAGGAARVPGHFIANITIGVDLLRDVRRRGRLTLQLDAENVTNEPYLIAQEGEFSPAQYSVPRLLTVTARLRF